MSPHFGSAPRGITSWALKSAAVGTGMVIAALAWPASSSADPTTDGTVTSVLSNVGIGNGGAVSEWITQVGNAICPLIAKQGGNVASNATQASGYGGIASTVTGYVAGQAIESQCPTIVSQLANGDFTTLVRLIQAANQASSVLPAADGNALPSAALTQLSGISPNS